MSVTARRENQSLKSNQEVEIARTQGTSSTKCTGRTLEKERPRRNAPDEPETRERPRRNAPDEPETRERPRRNAPDEPRGNVLDEMHRTNPST